MRGKISCRDGVLPCKISCEARFFVNLYKSNDDYMVDINEDNKLTFDGVISMYKNIGVVCE